MAPADLLVLVVGLGVVALVLADLTATLMVTWGAQGRWRPSRAIYRLWWRAWSAVGRRAADVDRRERALALFAPLSLLGLLLLWLGGLLVGWSLVWVALADDLGSGAVSSFGDAVYYSGVVLLTIGFGEITPAGAPARLLTLAEAATGLAGIALVISYLPVLYGAYGAREAQLLMLDDHRGTRMTPAGTIVVHAPGGDLERFYAWCREWERWVAQVLESHTSYPMLAYFRSQHRGQSWITGLGVILDASALAVCAIPGAREREAGALQRRAQRAVSEISQRLGVEPVEDRFLDRELFAFACGLLSEAGIPVVADTDAAFAELARLRPAYGGELQALFDHLVAPPGFWGHAADGSFAQPAIPAPRGEEDVL